MPRKTQPLPDKKAIKLTDAVVARLIAEKADGRWHDLGCHGLYLLIRNEGKAASWLHRYTDNRKDTFLTLGPLSKFDLEAAQERVKLNNARLIDGDKPQPLRIIPHVRGGVTLADDVRAYHQAHVADGHNAAFDGWSDNHAFNWLRSFENHILPHLGCVDTNTLTAKQIAGVLDPVWKTANATAQIIIMRLNAVIDHAMHIDPARFKGFQNPAKGVEAHMKAGYKQPTQHMVAIGWREVRPLFDALLAADQTDMAVSALILLILTCAPRAAEIYKLKWGMVDLETGTIIVPPANTKTKRNGRDERTLRTIPLCDEAISLLRSIQPANPHPDAFVFPGDAGLAADEYEGKVRPCKRQVAESTINGRIGHQRLRGIMALLGFDYDIHGFRTTFKGFVWDNIRDAADTIAVEIAADRQVGTKASEAYRDTSLFAHRRILANRWSAFLHRRAYTGPYRHQDELVDPNQMAA